MPFTYAPPASFCLRAGRRVANCGARHGVAGTLLLCCPSDEPVIDGEVEVMSPRTTTILAIAIASYVAAAHADERSSRDVLKEKGLMRIGSYHVLPEEKELAAGLEKLAPLKREMDAALKLKADYDAAVAETRQMLQNAVTERRRLTLMLLQSHSEEEAALVALRLLEVSDRISQLTRQLNDDQQAGAIQRRLDNASDAYTDLLFSLSELADHTEDRYEQLSDDEEVQAALDALRNETGRKISLGPRRIFLRHLNELRELENAVQVDRIELRREQEVFFIRVMLNEKERVDMMLDTGASLVALPADVAARIGVAPDEEDPSIDMHIANGDVVQGKLMSLDSVRVGKFRIEDVDCVVLPAEMQDAPMLLGGSFLHHFTYKIEPGSGRLTLSRVALPDDKDGQHKR